MTKIVAYLKTKLQYGKSKNNGEWDTVIGIRSCLKHKYQKGLPWQEVVLEYGHIG